MEAATVFEQKYRWRDAQRVCPQCGKNAIIKGKAEFGGGWLCFVKKGGCGAKFADGDQTIETQPVGRVPNPDVGRSGEHDSENGTKTRPCRRHALSR